MAHTRSTRGRERGEPSDRTGADPEAKRRRTQPAEASSSRPPRVPLPVAPAPSVPQPLPPSADDALGVSFADHAHRAAFDAMATRPVHSTRFVDRPLLERLGLWEQTVELYSRLGLSQFRQLLAPTYRRLTLEALSSLVCTREGISFRLLGRQRVLTRTHMRAIFGFPAYGRVPDLLTPASSLAGLFAHSEFWHSITGEQPFKPSRSKASRIVHPCLRYLQRHLAFTFFTRSEQGGLSVGELTALWGAVQPIVTEPDRQRHPTLRFDWASFLADRLAFERDASGPIHLGGFFTVVLHFLELAVPMGTALAVGPPTLDLTTLVRAKILVPRGERHWVYQVAEREYLLLPHPERTQVFTPEPWLLPAPQVVPDERAVRALEREDDLAAERAEGEEEESDQDISVHSSDTDARRSVTPVFESEAPGFESVPEVEVTTTVAACPPPLTLPAPVTVAGQTLGEFPRLRELPSSPTQPRPPTFPTLRLPETVPQTVVFTSRTPTLGRHHPPPLTAAVSTAPFAESVVVTPTFGPVAPTFDQGAGPSSRPPSVAERLARRVSERTLEPPSDAPLSAARRTALEVQCAGIRADMDLVLSAVHDLTATVAGFGRQLEEFVRRFPPPPPPVPQPHPQQGGPPSPPQGDAPV